MYLQRLKSNAKEFLSNWLYIGLFAACFFAMGSLFGWKAYVALKHNIGLNEVVTWYGGRNGHILQYYLSTLIVYSILWLLAGAGLLLAGWIHNRLRPGLKQRNTQSP